jgi:hypothetical protein
MTLLVEHLCSKGEALSSNFSPAKNQKGFSRIQRSLNSCFAIEGKLPYKCDIVLAMFSEDLNIPSNFLHVHKAQNN